MDFSLFTPGSSSLHEDILRDHQKNPRHKRKPVRWNACQNGKNPLCGDWVTIYLDVDETKMVRASFEGEGCSISQASASILCEAVTGKTPAEALELIARAEGVYTGRDACWDEDSPEFSDMDALAGVSRFPVRIKCAALAWKTLELAISQLSDPPQGATGSNGEMESPRGDGGLGRLGRRHGPVKLRVVSSSVDSKLES